MTRYLCLLRGINVGGKNKVSMAELRTALEAAGFKDVSTFINSGNIFVTSNLGADEVERSVELLISKSFRLDSELIKVRSLTSEELKKVIDKAPKGFGMEPEKYHSDALFTMGVSAADIMKGVSINPDVDAAWEGDGVVYFRRLSALRVKSRLARLVSKPIYKSVTIRSWNTTVKLSKLLT